MLDICDYFALEYLILFNAKKSKCISFSPCYGYLSPKKNLPVFFIGGSVVDYVKLFQLLVDRMLPPVSVRLLLNMYTSHVCCVSWNGVCSVPFSVLNGVKQGGVISPALFCIYVAKFLGKLAEAGVGCYIGNILLVLLHTQVILCYWLL